MCENYYLNIIILFISNVELKKIYILHGIQYTKLKRIYKKKINNYETLIILIFVELYHEINV